VSVWMSVCLSEPLEKFLGDCAMVEGVDKFENG